MAEQTQPTLSKDVPFDFEPRTRLIFGVNAVERIGELAVQLGARKLLLVTDAGIVSAGHAARVISLLERQHLKVVCFDQVEENPSTQCVEKCVDVARLLGIDTIVGLGGGSSMDTAKGCNFILSNGGHMSDYWGIGKAKLPMLPLIAIPTTGGTGSECQSFALITDERTHQKMACGDPKAAARIAILDPALTVSQPPRVTACSGIDAIAHAVETAVTRKRTPLSFLFSREAFRLTATGLPRVLSSPADLEARGRMLLGAALAGTAIENSMLGAAHSAANPLTAHFGTAHGCAVGLMLPHIVRFNSADPAAAQAYQEISLLAGICSSSDSTAVASEKLASHLENLLDLAGLPRSLKDCGAHNGDMVRLANEASSQWTAQFNPRTITSADFQQLYSRALE
ncbi:MAG TPA: iron-containing alcohol dehydrogenase [Verrucomicrobiae bacterium]|nr:iron-containing alcohol dehydrogenase [Verrucomicrobiae bacterium]